MHCGDQVLSASSVQVAEQLLTAWLLFAQDQNAGGASHRWKLYVRAPDNSDLSHVIAKVCCMHMQAHLWKQRAAM